MSNEQIIADLQATKDRMTPENWNPKGTIDENKRMCVLMHLRAVIDSHSFITEEGSQERYTQAGDALSLHIPDVSEPYYMLVGTYNDRASTHFEDIQALIDKALADLGGLG